MTFSPPTYADSYTFAIPRAEAELKEIHADATKMSEDLGVFDPIFTCVDCARRFICVFAFDLYNTAGDCLMEK